MSPVPGQRAERLRSWIFPIDSLGPSRTPGTGGKPDAPGDRRDAEDPVSLGRIREELSRPRCGEAKEIRIEEDRRIAADLDGQALSRKDTRRQLDGPAQEGSVVRARIASFPLDPHFLHGRSGRAL